MTIFTSLFTAGIFYLLTHFLVYVFFLRHKKFFLNERNIFLYHFLSAGLFAAFYFVYFALKAESGRFSLVCGMASLHGIYSLSFLELWSLCEAGYSLRVLDQVDKAFVDGQDFDRASLRNLGASKKENRAKDLETLGLLSKKDDKFTLSAKGRGLAIFLQGITWPSNAKRID